MKIVQIEDFFHPDAGYQVNILAKYFSKKGHEVIIITAEMDKIPDELTSFFGKDNIDEKDRDYEREFNVQIIRVPVKKYISGRVIYEKCIEKKVKELKPDVLYVHGNDTFIGIQYILKAKKLSFPIVSDSHMLEMASKNKFSKFFRLYYKLFVTPKIIKYQIPIIRTQNDSYVEKCLGIPLEQAPWISYGSDMMLFHQDEKKRILFREQNNISKEDFVVVFAGKLIESKGAMLLAKTFVKRFNTKKKVVLIAVGNTSGQYGKMVEEEFANSENRVLRFPTQKYRELAIFYQASDLAVFAKQCSLSFYDVQACGLPVVSENNNINIDRCSHDNGLCFEMDSIESFREAIERFVNMSDMEFDKYKRNSISFVKNGYDYDLKADEYLNIINCAFLKAKGEKNG